MKKLLLILISSSTCITAFAQGKISFANDSLHLVYYAPGAGALAGQAVSLGNMPVGVNLVADLYGGTSSSSLTLQTTTTFAVTAGRFATVNFTTPSAGPAGQPNFFQVQIRDSAYATEAESEAFSGWGGHSTIFTTVSGASIAYNSIVSPGAPGNSTWAVGNFDMSAQAGLAGARGAIAVGIPEPPSVIFAAVGASSLILYRRR